MNYELKNGYLTAQFTNIGAELISLKDKSDTEYIWNADERYWKRHTPILFPIVGKILEGKYIYEEKEYTLPAHGFARDLTFAVEESTDETICFVLEASEATKSMYPFDFLLKVIYTLQGKKLNIAYEVFNKDTARMYFKIGAHPGIMCPFFENERVEDYYLEFEKEEEATQIPITSEIYLSKARRRFKGKVIDFNKELETEGVIVLEGYKSKSISLGSVKHDKKLTVAFEGFPFLGIWRPENSSPFLCIEPWYGHADFEDDVKELSDKKDMIHLESMAVFKCMHSISL